MSKASKEFKRRLKPGYTAECAGGGGQYTILVYASSTIIPLCSFPAEADFVRCPTKPAAWEYALEHGEDVLEPEQPEVSGYVNVHPIRREDIERAAKAFAESGCSITDAMCGGIAGLFARKTEKAVAEDHLRPFVQLAAHCKISIDGNQWCVLYGENLQDGVAGFGDSPELASRDFDKNWAAPFHPAPQPDELTELREQARVLAKAATITRDTLDGVDPWGYADVQPNGLPLSIKRSWGLLHDALAQPAIAALLEVQE